MGINTGVRKVWLFKCQNSENGPFIYFLYLKKGGLYLAALKRGVFGRTSVLCQTYIYIGSYPRECRKGRSKVMQTVALQCILKVKQDLC